MSGYGSISPHEDRALIVSSPIAPAFARQSSTMSAHSETTEPSCPNEKETKKGNKLTKRQIFVCISISLFYFSIMCTYSMLAPFFPGEGKRKGASLAVVGLIFAVFPFVSFLTAPIFGILIPKIGAKFMLCTGLFVEGSTLLLFGFVALMPDGTLFVVFCFLIRIICGLGSSATATSSMAIVTETFQESLSTAMVLMMFTCATPIFLHNAAIAVIIGLLETFAGLGLMIGPVVGGVLFGLGGFKLPFLVMGSIVLASLVLVIFVLPPDRVKDPSESTGEEKLSPLILYKNPAIILIATVIAVGGTAIAFLDPTLALHLKQFHLSHEEIGLMFLIFSAVYTFFAPLFGYFADRKDTRIMIGSGTIIAALALLLLGPSPFLSKFLPSKVWLNGVALAVLGFGVTTMVIPTIADMFKSARKQGLPDDLGTHGVISGIFNAVFNVGAIIGPTVGGTLSQKLSFEWASTLLSGLLLLMALAVIIFTIVERIRDRNRTSEYTQLLVNPPE